MIALNGGEIVYFEMDITGQLNEYTDRKEMNGNVICMTLGTVPVGQLRTRFLAVGLDDNTVRIISLDPQVINFDLNVVNLSAQMMIVGPNEVIVLITNPIN